MAAVIFIACLAAGCGAQGGSGDTGVPKVGSLKYEGQMDLVYATTFDVYYYEGGYALIRIYEDNDYLVIPEGGSVPDGIDESITVLHKPVKNMYLAATSAMALFDAIDSVDSITMSGTQASGWYIDAAVEALNEGRMTYAGKYSQPDYETLIKMGCELAIESTMIYHTPKVKEMIEDLGIPVMVDRSSNESHPLGRTEWVKLYAVLTGKEAEAEEFFRGQIDLISGLEGFENTEKTIVYFYVATNGSVVIRNPKDYIPTMIEIAGGRYAFADLQTPQTSTSISMTMEEFYNTAVKADYIIYNAAIDSPITSIDDLIGKDVLFEEFKAVKENRVYSTGKSFYQATDIVGEMIIDMHRILTEEDPKDLTFLTHVE
ncbi:MAG: ABC transporter substrate-binding protein [Eubacteriaceae bacterium]|nr:ABC transporter substrate-binding protein [Eubacteriaceae bacterium]